VSGGKSQHQTTKPGGLMVSDTQLCHAVVGYFCRSNLLSLALHGMHVL